MYCSVCFKLLVGVDCFPTDISFEKTKFLFANGYNLEITYGLGIRHVSTSSNSRAPFCAEQYIGPVPAPSISVSSCVFH